jgi:hypothetical protein
VIVSFVDIGRIDYHHCLEVIVSFVDIGRIDDHHCLEVIVSLTDIGRIDDHHYLEVIVSFVDIVGNPFPGLRQSQKCGRVKSVNWISTFSLNKTNAILRLPKKNVNQKFVKYLNCSP